MFVNRQHYQAVTLFVAALAEAERHAKSPQMRTFLRALKKKNGAEALLAEHYEKHFEQFNALRLHNPNTASILLDLAWELAQEGERARQERLQGTAK